jgi:hypothetical protein
MVAAEGKAVLGASFSGVGIPVGVFPTLAVLSPMGVTSI